ncbi:MAG: chorismate synthase [Acidobacteriota bacterium]
MLRFLTAGESHGPELTVILEGLPMGLELDLEAVQRDMARRQQGYGRGARMKIEKDRAELVGGVRHGRTTGGPICLRIRNRDWENWQDQLSPYPDQNTREPAPLVRPRPGHADLAGAFKYGVEDFRDILERSSARETAARVAGGALAKQFLQRLGCAIGSHVIAIGSVRPTAKARDVTWKEIIAIPKGSLLRCTDREHERRMIQEIDRATEEKDTVGGVFEVVAHTPPPGLGSFTQWDRKLDGRLAQAILSIPAVKAVGFGRGADSAFVRGSALHDEILYAPSEGLCRSSNNAGGLEGGVTNGQELRVTAYMKPLSSLRRPLRSVNIRTRQSVEAARVRSDICAVPAAGVVGEAMVALTLAEAALEKFGGDSLSETLAHYEAHMRRVQKLVGKQEPASR